MRQLGTIEARLFSQGWVFLVAYLAVYFAFYRLPLGATLTAFHVLHWAFLVLAVDYTRRRWRSWGQENILFWVLMAALLWLPGAYLEYPSDAFEHFRRIFTWSTVSSVSEHPAPYRFAYFLAWSFIDWVPIEWRRPALDLWSMATQLFVLKQVHDLAVAFGVPGRWVKMQVVGFLVFFGTNVFGLRYYALSASPLAYGAAMRWIALCIRDSRFVPKVPAALALMTIIAYNHKQEFAFIALASGFLFALQAYRYRPRLFLATAIPLGLAACVWAWYAVNADRWPYYRVARDAFTFLGSYNFALNRSTYLATLGVHGVLAWVFAFIYRRQNPRLALLTIAPPLCLVFPPFSAFIAAATLHWYDSYRILYAFPTSLMLVEGLRHVGARYVSRHALTVAFCAVLALSALPFKPFWGRLFFVFHQPDPVRTLSYLDPMILWFRANWPLALEKGQQVRVISDSLTNFYLNSHFGLEERSERLLWDRWGQVFGETGDLVDLAKRDVTVWGFLVADPARCPAPGPSPVAALSHHWEAQKGELGFLSTQTFRDAAKGLTQFGWKAIEVPPCYVLYLPAGSARFSEPRKP